MNIHVKGVGRSIIGQPCGLIYSGNQACSDYIEGTVPRQKNDALILVNSNPIVIIISTCRAFFRAGIKKSQVGHFFWKPWNYYISSPPLSKLPFMAVISSVNIIVLFLDYEKKMSTYSRVFSIH